MKIAEAAIVELQTWLLTAASKSKATTLPPVVPTKALINCIESRVLLPVNMSPPSRMGRSSPTGEHLKSAVRPTILW